MQNSFLNSVTKPVIIEYENQKTLNALQAVSNGLTISEENIIVEDNSFVNYYYTLSNNGETEGYLLSLSAVGYGGQISLVASYNKEGEVLQAKVVSDSETPGLGKKSEEDWYMTKYIKKDPVPTKKTQLSAEDAQAVSGASITFTAIGNALQAGSTYVKDMGAN